MFLSEKEEKAQYIFDIILKDPEKSLMANSIFSGLRIAKETFNREPNIILPRSAYFFTKCERKAPKFIYGDTSSLKNNDSISLFFIVLYF